MQIQPILPLFVLIPLLLIALGLSIYLCQKSLYHASKNIKRWVMALRLCALLLIAALLLNIGQYKSDAEVTQPEWIVLVDDSSSMEVQERIDQAKDMAKKVQKHAKDKELPLSIFTYNDKLSASLTDIESIQASGSASVIEDAGSQLFSKYNSSGKSIAGILLLSDGRQTKKIPNSKFNLQATSNNTPFYNIPLGGDYHTPDIEVLNHQRVITCFKDQEIQISALCNIYHTKPHEAKISLHDAEGTLIDEVTVTFTNKDTAQHIFSLKAPAASTYYTLKTAVLDGEIKTSNNTHRVNLRVLNSKTKVFFAEGAPYWDSKFLAQLLRKQKYMDVTAAYRLNEEKWFVVDSNNQKPVDRTDQVIPSTLSQLKQYDVIILGKNIDTFLDEKNIQAIIAYVRDHGGAVLFARGKSYAADRLELIKKLEPVEWGKNKFNALKVNPTTDGESIGLFNQVLPGRDSPIWAELPPLKDANEIKLVKPFTRTLASGTSSGKEFPMLMVRRYGQGVTGIVNADGLWKWDFYPEARNHGNMYHEFWAELIQWMVSYSEFLPGYEYSLNTSKTIVQQGEDIAVNVGYRGQTPSENIALLVTDKTGKKVGEYTLASFLSDTGRKQWRTNIKLENAGEYQCRLINVKTDYIPELTLSVKPPPNEKDNLTADHGFLRELAEKTGGKLLSPDTLDTFLKETMLAKQPTQADGNMIWKPFLLHWIVGTIIALILGVEWWIRRRNGMI